MKRIVAASALWVMVVAAHAAQPATPLQPVPIKVGTSGYYVLGQGGLATAANQGYNSNAGFVVTSDGVVVIEKDQLAHLIPAAHKKVEDEAKRIAQIQQGNTAASWLVPSLRAAGVLKEGETL